MDGQRRIAAGRNSAWTINGDLPLTEILLGRVAAQRGLVSSIQFCA
ncbi:MAG: hypothetical protein J1D88_04805 [Treponema sp.]|nr:hypothetical protein [Treponema sp.]